MGRTISQLDAAGPLTGGEKIPMIQEGRAVWAQPTAFTPLLDSGCKCTLVSRTNTVGTDANTLEKFLQTYMLPGGTLRTDGSWIEIFAWGSFANNTQKTINFNFGGLTLTSGAGTVNNASWDMSVIVSRASQTSQKIKMGIIAQSNGSSWTSTTSVERNGVASEDLNIDVPLSVSAQNGTANANDITIEAFIVRLNEIDVNS